MNGISELIFTLYLCIINNLKKYGMKTNAICPISINKVDENVARLNGIFTVLLLVVFALTGNILPVLFLLIDFVMRGAELSKFSPLAIISKLILTSLNIHKKPINAGPKIFAARIGILFSFGIVLFYFLQIQSVALIFTGVFAFCAFLEGFFGYCVACQIYPFVYKFTFKSAI